MRARDRATIVPPADWPEQLRSDYAAALRRLYALGAGRMLPGRERLRELLARAGDPHLMVPSVLVGGTNGKGRLVAGLSAVLAQRHGVGAFLKPHLKSIRERWRIGDQPVSPELFIEYAHRSCDLIDSNREPISFFEANVLLGSLLFAEQGGLDDGGCDIAVWEVGLGGKHDACNLLDSQLSIVTNVQRDHEAILGDTLELIAEDKVHIARSGRPLLIGPPRPSWETDYAKYAPVLREVGKKLGARVHEINVEDYRPLLGLPDDTNALLQAALEQLSSQGFSISPAAVLDGLRRMHYRGRMEQTTLNGTPVLLDAAHNADSMRWLGNELQRLAPGEGWIVIFGCQNTKRPAELLQGVRASVDLLVPVVVPVLHPASLADLLAAAEQLGLLVSLPDGLDIAAVDAQLSAGSSEPLDTVTELDPPDDRTRWIESVRHGLQLSRALGKPAVICGSIYYLGEILRAFEDGWA